MSQKNAFEYFRLFFEAGHAILSSSSLQQTLDFLVQNTVAALNVKAGSLRLIDEKTNRLELVASCGLSSAYLNKGALDADKSMPQVLEGEPVVIQDAFDDPRVQYRQAMRDEGVNTVLSVPVEARDKTIGVLRLYSAQRRDFSVEEIEFVAALAELGGLAIVNARIYEAEGVKLASLLSEIGIEIPPPDVARDQLQGPFALQPVGEEKSLEYFRALHEVSRAILSTLDSREVMTLIIEKAIRLMQVKGSALRLINETTRELELLVSRGLSDRFLKKGVPHTDKSICDSLEGKPVLILDTATDPRLEYPEETLAEGIASILSVPILARDRVIGVLRLYSGERREFGQEEVTFVSALAEIAGIAIMNARLYEKTTYDLSFWTATMDYLKEKP